MADRASPPRLAGLLPALLSMTLCCGPTWAQASEGEDAVRRSAIIEDAARYAFSTYSACCDRAATLRAAIDQLTETPTDAALQACRQAWIAARDVYGTSEVLRFSDGPIDDRRTGVETYLNAWPVDESYIDGVVGRPSSGIVHDEAKHPHLTGIGLQLANERGGEKNVSIGWHAIEFLLWGQDLDADGPGARPARDFAPSLCPSAPRRCAYLKLTAELLTTHLASLREAWAPDRDDNYRARFLRLDSDEALRRILRGMVVLSGFEMSGERMAVAYETRDQEDEHSCFSDTTHRDFIANQRGIRGLYRGEGAGMAGHGLRALAHALDAAAAQEIDRLMERSTRGVESLPAPFDRLLRAADGSPERAQMLATIEALELQAEALAALGLELGFEVPMSPSGQ